MIPPSFLQHDREQRGAGSRRPPIAGDVEDGGGSSVERRDGMENSRGGKMNSCGSKIDRTTSANE